MWLPLLMLACTSAPRLTPAERAELVAALEVPGGAGPAADGAHNPEIAVQEGPPVAVTGGSMTAVSFPLGLPTRSGRPFVAAGALLRPDEPTGAAVLVAHGHFEGGKSTPEAQAIARRLVARGALVLVVDTPGVEEWDRPDRRIHFAEGAHNRAFLASGGSSALALQLAGLRRGLDILQQLGARRIAVTGASGGAAQAFYLGLVDDRVSALVLASVPPMPRELRATGCACDQVPGWPGPDPRVLAALDRPTLWMTEVPSPRPEGLRRKVAFEVVEGDHGYPVDMQRKAVDFLDDALNLRSLPWEAEPDIVDLRSEGVTDDAPGIFDLVLNPTWRWRPAPDPTAPYELECEGAGPVVILAGGEQQDRLALRGAGFQPCSLVVRVDDADLAEAIGAEGATADALAGSVARAARARGAVAAYGVRAWGLPVGGSGLPFVVRDPLTSPDQVDPAVDPAWVHVPGAWWGASAAVLDRAVASGPAAGPLAEALAALAAPE